MANVTKLLCGSKEGVDLLSKLEPLPQERADLREAKTRVRAHLRETFATIGRQTLGRVVRVGFFTQGSDAYKTLNRPAHMPPQQMDFDDGMYLPLSYMQNVPRPSTAAAVFFNIVDASLEQLAAQEGWKADRSKPTCARLIVSEKSHIDVPLYAIPDAEFETLAKAVRDSAVFATDEDIDILAESIRGDSWAKLPTEMVLLAHRIEDWIHSDPRKVHAWFVEQIAYYGEQFRRQCRYLKAWRDQHRLSLCSLLLMVCAWKVYEEIGARNMPSRDDLALAKIASHLPRLLRRGGIENPTDRDEKLDERFTREERQIAIEKTSELSDDMTSIVEHCYNPHAAIDTLRRVFGDRIAVRPDLVGIEQPAREVLSKAPAYVAAPEVRRSTSG